MWQHFANNDPARVTSGTNAGCIQPGLPKGGSSVNDEDDEVQRVLRDIGPWAVAVVVHAAMVLLAIVLVWANLAATEEEKTIVPSFKMNQPAERLQMKFEHQPRTVVSPVPPRGTESEKRQTPSMTASSAALAITLGTDGGDNTAEVLQRSSSKGVPQGIYEPPGSTGTNANSFAFVIDASGSMVDTVPFVIHELKRSLRTLGEKHSFTVIFYQNGQVIEPLSPGLKQASRDNVIRMMNWLDDGGVAPHGLTSPLPAIQTALKYKPDLVYLLSDNVTGRGIYEITQDVLLTQIKGANEGRTKINTIQFLHPDPLTLQGMRGTLELISEQSGGLNRFVRPSDIWLDAPLSQ